MRKSLPQYFALAVLLVVCLVLIGNLPRAVPGQADYRTPDRIPGVTAENYPIVDGSTSTIPLGQLLLCRGMGLPGELGRNGSSPLFAHHGQRGGDVAVHFPLTVSPQQGEQYRGILYQRARHRGTHEAYLHLLGEGNGAQPAADLILVAREPSEDELAAAKHKGIIFDVRPVALDAFIFLANIDNPVSNLSLAQIRDIYGGKHTNWNEVGGKDAAIEAFIRNRNSGSQELMEKLVMQGRPITVKASATVTGMMGVIERISETPNGLAYSVYYYEQVMVPDPRNKLLGVDGVHPTRATIANRQYPLVSEVYVVTRKGIEADSATARLRDWLLSDDGQRLVGASGYLPIRTVTP
jgi:phosphate transport system substrate-binding protein